MTQPFQPPECAGDTPAGDPPCCSPSVAATGLCLADGTPVASLFGTDCADCGAASGDPEYLGWVNLLTGAFTAGAVPAGAKACGERRDFELGQWCDLDAEGEVIAAVLVEYEYDEETGALSGTRLLTPDGQPYTLVGTLGVCSKPCGDTTTLLLCDPGEGGGDSVTVDGTATDTATIPPGAGGPTSFPPLAGGGQPLWDGGELIFPAEGATLPNYSGTYRTVQGLLRATPPACTDDSLVTLTATVLVENLGPQAGQQYSGKLAFYDDAMTLLANQSLLNTPVNSPRTLTITTAVTQAQLAAGTLRVSLDLETGQGEGRKSWRASDFVFTATYGTVGCPSDTVTPFLRHVTVDCEGAVTGTNDTTLDGSTPYTPVGEPTVCGAASEEHPDHFDVEVLQLCDTPAGGEPVPFLRRYLWDTHVGGDPVFVVDTALDGTTPYTAVGEIGLCPTPCQDAISTLLLCDTIPDPGGVPTSGNTNATAHPFDADPRRCVNQAAGDVQALWDGGSLTIPPDTTATGTCDPEGVQVLRGVAATLQADRPVCDDGTVTITVTLVARNDGPSTSANNYAGTLRLHRTDTGERVGQDGQTSMSSTPPGGEHTLSVTATVPAEVLAAGQVVVVQDVETFDATGVPQPNSGTGWTLTQYEASYAYGQSGCGEEILATVVTDCETGEVTSVTYSTLAGEPYTPVGEVGQCPTSSEAVEPEPHPNHYVVTRDELCMYHFAGGHDSATLWLETVYDAHNGTVVSWRLADADGSTFTPLPDTVIRDCNATRDVEQQILCDTLPDGSVVRFLRNYHYFDGGFERWSDTALTGGAVYEPQGTVAVCEDPLYDVEREVFCSFDANGAQVGRLFEVMVYDARTGAFVSRRLENFDGTPYVEPPGSVIGTCRDDRVDTVVATGSRRLTDDTVRQNLKTDYPGLQSVTITVLAGTVNVNTSNTGAGSTPFPAGTSHTWSVSDTDDSTLGSWGATGTAGSDYLLVWTYKTSPLGY